MQRMSLLAAGAAILSFAATGCAAQTPPPAYPEVIETLAHQPSIIRVQHEFFCLEGNEVRVEWGRRLPTAARREAGYGGAEVMSLEWAGRRASAEELAAINAVVAPYMTPRGSSIACRSDRNVMTLEFWELHNGETRVAIEMDAAGFRPTTPLN